MKTITTTTTTTRKHTQHKAFGDDKAKEDRGERDWKVKQQQKKQMMKVS